MSSVCVVPCGRVIVSAKVAISPIATLLPMVPVSLVPKSPFVIEPVPTVTLRSSIRR